MTPPELYELVKNSPVVLAELAAAATAVSVALGAVGTAIEHAGDVWNMPTLERFGQRIEATFADLPKLWRGSRSTNELRAKVDAALAGGAGGAS